ncbi:MAG: leucine-rich repeat domain-containing protein [Kamptonema sp. SIO1D9]|nr:leucine-rich repeat domain-containing protein [Kamptonema sp. SIO1D9]
MGQEERDRTIKALCEVAKTSDVEEAFRILNSQTKLILRGQIISDLNPLRSLVNPTSLSMQGNHVRKLSFGNSHSNLKYLYLCCNQITDLTPLRSLSHLESLWLSGNQISDLTPLEVLINLRSLGLSTNQISDLIPLRSFSHLESLWLDGNQISDLTPLEVLINLRSLGLSTNQISDLTPLISLVNLEYLSLSDNQISDLTPLKSLPKLKTFSIFYTELPRKYWTRIDEWKPEWLLTEKNAEVRRVLIQQIGYEKICSELGATEVDAWREYVLFRIDAEIDEEPIFLLKMIDPSTNDIYFLRVPPNLDSAREAIRWLNHGVDPEEFAVET